MNQTVCNWLTAITAAAALICCAYLLDGPSEAETQAVQAADLADAKVQARRVAAMTRKCRALYGRDAELEQVRDSDEYVCRNAAIEPTPADLLHRYALLGGAK